MQTGDGSAQTGWPRYLQSSVPAPRPREQVWNNPIRTKKKKISSLIKHRKYSSSRNTFVLGPNADMILYGQYIYIYIYIYTYSVYTYMINTYDSLQGRRKYGILAQSDIFVFQVFTLDQDSYFLTKRGVLFLLRTSRTDQESCHLVPKPENLVGSSI